MIAGSCDVAYSTFINNSASFGGIMLLSDTLLWLTAPASVVIQLS